MSAEKNTNKRSIEKQHKAIKELQAEIAKGWNGTVSKRSVREIVAAKLRECKA